MKFYGINVSETPEKSGPADIMKLLDAMRPKPSPSPLIRIGPGGDGTYLLPDDLDGVIACFSPGVDNFKNFEDHLTLRHGIAAHLCDGSSDLNQLRTPLIKDLQTFENLWLDINEAEDSVSLDAWIARHHPDPEDDLILQMDIEGAEYRNILHTSDKTLKRFRIIVMEIHGLDMITHDGVLSEVLLPFFDRLVRHFTCVHAHPNNFYGPVNIPGIDVPIPRLVELTFIRNDRYKNRELHDVQLPHPHDIGFNVADKPPIFLDDFFRGRPPSERETLRIIEDLSDWRHRELVRRIDDQSEVLAKTIAENEKTIAENEKTIADLQEKYQLLLKRLDRIHASNSWRLTAPLRWLSSKVVGKHNGM